MRTLFSKVILYPPLWPGLRCPGLPHLPLDLGRSHSDPARTCVKSNRRHATREARSLPLRGTRRAKRGSGARNFFGYRLVQPLFRLVQASDLKPPLDQASLGQPSFARFRLDFWLVKQKWWLTAQKQIVSCLWSWLEMPSLSKNVIQTLSQLYIISKFS